MAEYNLMRDLNNKEITAMTLKYNGHTYKQICKKIEVGESTVENWFGKNGKLRTEYADFVKDIDQKRQKSLIEGYAETDKNILLATSLIMQGLMKRFDKTALEQGNAKKINPGMLDYKMAWEIQRVMQGLPTDVKNQNMNFDHDKIDSEIEKFNALFEKKDDKAKDEVPKKDEEKTNEA